MNGIAPAESLSTNGAALYFTTTCCCAGVSWSSGSYCPFLRTFVVVSTPWKDRYWLGSAEPWNDSVGVLGNESSAADVVSVRPLKVPNRDSAMITGQRWAAQNGQY